MRSTSLGDLRNRVRIYADILNDDYYTDAELNQYINDAMTELYDMLVAAYGQDYYLVQPPPIFPVVSGQTSYPLPADFYQLKGVDVQLNQSLGTWLSLKRYNFNERNLYNWTPIAWNILGVVNVSYHLQGNTIAFIPQPVVSTALYRLWYIPACPILVADSDAFDGVAGWEKLIVLDAAIRVKQKSEQDTSLLERQKAEMVARIEAMKGNRDAGEAPRVTDVDRTSTFPFTGSDAEGG